MPSNSVAYVVVQGEDERLTNENVGQFDVAVQLDVYELTKVKYVIVGGLTMPRPDMWTSASRIC